MNVLVISTNRNRVPLPVMPIGACLVAEIAERAGHRVSLLDLMFRGDPPGAFTAAVDRTRPDAIAISVRNIDNNDRSRPAYFIAEVRAQVAALRETTDAVIVLGGAAVSVMPREVLAATGADIAVAGDGDGLFPTVLDRISENRPLDDLPGVVLPGGLSAADADCASAMLGADRVAPDYSRWIDVPSYCSEMATAPIQTKQGCPFRCVYCTYRKIEGGTYRFADPAAVAGRVAQLSTQGLRDIEFVDSVFNAPVDHAMQVCEMLARTRHGARIHSLELNPASFDDDLLAAMERAGFTCYGLTADSASDRVLAAMQKGFASAQVHAAADAVKRHRLPCAWIFLLGGPGETRETVRETLRFADRSIRRTDAVFFTSGVRIYPDTGLEKIARDQGVLTAPREEMLEPVFYLSPQVDGTWLAAETKRFAAGHSNVIDAGSLNFPLLPAIHRAAYRLGVRPPIWRYTRCIRRGLRLAGMGV